MNMTSSALRLLCQFKGGKVTASNSLLLYICKDLSGIRRRIYNSARLLSESNDGDSSSDEEEKKRKKKSTKDSSVQKRLNKLLSSMPVEVSKGEIKPGFSGEFYKEVKTAAKDVAQTIGGDTKKTESELLSRLMRSVEEKGQEIEPSAATKPSINLSELIVGMKIDRTPKESMEAQPRKSISEELLREEQSTSGLRRERFDPKTFTRTAGASKRTRMPLAKVDLFGGPPLGIFKSPSTLKAGPELSTWKHLAEREMRLSITHPPANVFEEMVHWTNKGILWHFPINNEQGAEEEANISFTEHIFLDQHLKPWCPSKGPIRHFMELVCVGLSKNPYFTAEEKKEYILWYRDYFMEKSKILEEVGLALNTEEQKRIE